MRIDKAKIPSGMNQRYQPVTAAQLHRKQNFLLEANSFSFVQSSRNSDSIASDCASKHLFMSPSQNKYQ